MPQTRSDSRATFETIPNLRSVLVIEARNLLEVSLDSPAPAKRETNLLIEHFIPLVDIRDITFILIRPLA